MRLFVLSARPFTAARCERRTRCGRMEGRRKVRTVVSEYPSIERHRIRPSKK